MLCSILEQLIIKTLAAKVLSPDKDKIKQCLPKPYRDRKYSGLLESVGVFLIIIIDLFLKINSNYMSKFYLKLTIII